MVRLIRETDVEGALQMHDTVEALRQAFVDYSSGRAYNEPRSRVKLNGEILHVLPAALPRSDAVGLKSYTAFRAGIRFHTLLYSASTGELKAIIQSKRLGELRTGGTTSLALQSLSPDSARTGVLIGVGNISRAMLEGMLTARKLDCVYISSRRYENAQSFCRDMTPLVDADLVPVRELDDSVSASDIIVTATTAKTPVFDGRKLRDGVTVAAAGSNLLQKRELDSEVIKRADRVIVESIDQAKREAGDLFPAIDSGFLHWNQVEELGDIVSRKRPGRQAKNETIVFKSVGLGLQDMAVAAKMFEIALAQGLGEEVDI